MKKILLKIKTKKIYVIVIIAFFVLLGISFANTNTGGGAGEGGSSFGSFLMSIADLLMSIWLIFPIIAGKLLTNDFVYGSTIGLDATLWHVWNFSRTIANYLIGFLFIYMIFRYLLFFSDKDASSIKSGLPKIVLSSILVNMSWFLLGVLIDLSTILIAAFGSMPANMNVATPVLVMPKNMEITVQKCDPQVSKACIKGNFNTEINKKNPLTLADLQTYETTISGPLMFIGMSILEIPTMKDNLLNDAYDKNSGKFKHDGDAIKAIIQIFLFIMFLVPIIILIVVNLVRIFWLWMYISFSPLLVLDWIRGKNKLAGTNKAFAFKNAIGLIFSPALVVLGFAISTIFVIGVADALNTTEGEGNIYTERVKRTFLLGSGGNIGNGVLQVDFGESEDTGRTGSKYIGGFIGYLIVIILTVILVWSVMKLSFKASEVTSGISDKMFNFSEELFKTIPIPTPLGQVSIGSIKGLGRHINAIPGNLLSDQTERLNNIFHKESDIKPNDLNELLLNLKNNSAFNNAIDKAFSEISRFKNKPELNSSKNVQKIIDELTKAIQGNGQLSAISSQFSKGQTYREKLNILLSHQNDIKKRLRSIDFK